MKSKHQLLVEGYHAAIETGHGGHNMHLIHRAWHQANRNPPAPGTVDPDWGVNLDFGYKFLQMHHEMVKATSQEDHHYMHHDSIAQWYADNGHQMAAEWDPRSEIPEELGYDPDPAAFPEPLLSELIQALAARGQTIDEFLPRRTNSPGFELPAYFTVAGVQDPGEADPFTGAMKLADFKNPNQLGCSLVFPHDQWHGSIGGAMGSTWTAIADPIFYLGVHWHIDRIYDNFKLIQSQRRMFTLDEVMLRRLEIVPAPAMERIQVRSEGQEQRAAEMIEASRKFHAPIGD